MISETLRQNDRAFVVRMNVVHKRCGEVMNRFIRRMLIGAIAGAVSSAALVIIVGGATWSVPLGTALGAIYSLSLKPTPFSYLDNLMAAGSFGMPLWGLISVIAIPFLSGHQREWSAEQMREHFPSLVGWVLYCCLVGLIIQALNDFARSVWGPEVGSKTCVSHGQDARRSLGRGVCRYAGCGVSGRTFSGRSLSVGNSCEQHERTSVHPDVSGGCRKQFRTEPYQHTLRSLHGVEFIRAHVTGIDLARRCVLLESRFNSQEEASSGEIVYDHLILALGAVSSYLGLANVEKLAFDFKSLLDAIRIRNHVIEMFERADREPDASRDGLLTFVIAGGGFAGVELAGALNDFAHGILADYPNLNRDELNVVLVHSRDRILPELSESLAKYAQKKMEARGVRFRLNARLQMCEPGSS